jgi:hypothetical protein
MPKIITANSVSIPQVVEQVPNQPFEAQRRGDRNNHLVIPPDWAEFVYGEITNKAPQPKAIELRINPALERRRMYAYFYINSSLLITPNVQLNLAWEEQRMFKLPLFNVNGALTVDSFGNPTGSLPLFPVAGGNVVQNSIQLLIANQLPLEPASAILQAYEFQHRANKMLLDVNTIGGTLGVQTFYRIWIGCFSW